MGELLADNPLYKKQLKPLLNSRKRKLKLPSVYHLQSLNEALLVDLVVEGCVCTNVPLDTGSDVNIMTEETAKILGFTNLSQSASILKPVDQGRLVPLGDLHDVPFYLSDQRFSQDFIVIRIPSPAPFPILLGRPFMYASKMVNNFITKEVTFGNPRRTLSWSKVSYQGETPSSDPGYTSGEEDNIRPKEPRVKWAQQLTTNINYLEVFLAPNREKDVCSNHVVQSSKIAEGSRAKGVFKTTGGIGGASSGSGNYSGGAGGASGAFCATSALACQEGTTTLGESATTSAVIDNTLGRGPGDLEASLNLQ